jgi:hypothetical protein
MEWLQKCRKKEADTLNSQVVGERRHAIKLRTRAEECVRLLQSYGAVQRGHFEDVALVGSRLLNDEMRLPSATVGAPLRVSHSLVQENMSDNWLTGTYGMSVRFGRQLFNGQAWQYPTSSDQKGRF